MKTAKNKRKPATPDWSLSSYLKTKRIEAGVTQAKAATVLGYTSPQYISNFERGLTTPSPKLALKLSKVYGFSKSELFEVMVKAYSNTLQQEFKRAS